MNKLTLFKLLSYAFMLLLILITLVGIFFFPSSAAKLICSLLCLLGFLLAGAVYAVCRTETLLMADALENTLLAAEQGNLPESKPYYGEKLTHRLCHRAVRLSEATISLAQEQIAMQTSLQSTINDLAHQLRTPIANLTLYADTLAAGDLSHEKQSEFLTILTLQAHKLGFLVDALVKTGRLETGCFQMNPQLHPLRNTLEQSASLIKPQAISKGLSFTLNCPNDLVLWHDAKWTSEAVYNLLDNAVKYTASGSITLTVQKWELYTCIEVSDTGQGFIKEDAAKLFTRFYRGKQTADLPGIGLGLYIVRRIADLQGGYVQAKAISQGAVFRLFLPNTLPDRA